VGCVGYTLIPLTVFPPQGLLSFPYFLVTIDEGHFIGFPVTSLLASLKSCLVEALRQINSLFHQGTLLGEKAALAC